MSPALEQTMANTMDNDEQTMANTMGNQCGRGTMLIASGVGNRT